MHVEHGRYVTLYLAWLLKPTSRFSAFESTAGSYTHTRSAARYTHRPQIASLLTFHVCHVIKMAGAAALALRELEPAERYED